jgi:hypothetical protein
MILDVIFWIFFIIWAVSAIAPVPAPYARAPWVCALICAGILGYKVVAFR